jgi:hypothetical protein
MAIGFSRTSKRLSIARSLALVGGAEATYLALNAAGWLRGAGARNIPTHYNVGPLFGPNIASRTILIGGKPCFMKLS